MLNLFIAAMLSLSGYAHAECSAHCTPGVSYACGDGCTSVHKHCHKPTTSACNDGTGSQKKTYSNPKKVEPTDRSKDKGAMIRNWVNHARQVAS